jgi:hypothetical protein
MVPDAMGDYVRYHEYMNLLARIVEMERDAARYQWIRTGGEHFAVLYAKYAGEALDAEVDAALSAGKELTP